MTTHSQLEKIKQMDKVKEIGPAREKEGGEREINVIQRRDV
jgi:hypothetical protein